MAEDLMKTFNEALVQNIKEADELLLPLLKQYLNEVRGIRMSMAEEVRTIIQSARQLNEITRGNAALLELCETILKLDKALTPEMMDKLRRLTKEE